MSGNGQVGIQYFNTATPLTVEARDANGNLVPNLPVSWAVTQGQGTVVSPPDRTDSNGRASAYYRGDVTPGYTFSQQTVLVSSSVGSATFVVTTNVSRLPNGSMAGWCGLENVQVPPSFTATPEAVDYLGWLLRTFSSYALAVELRHRSWSDAERDTRDLLDAYGAAWVLIDEPKFQFSIRQRLEGPHAAAPRTPAEGIAYMRFHGRNAAEWWRHAAAEDRYDYLYTATELRPFAEAATSAAARVKKAYLFFNNHFAAQGVANAVQLRQQLGMPPARKLPKELLEAYPWLESGPAPST